MIPDLKRQPDFEQLLRAVERRQRPDRLPFYEHKTVPGFIAQATGLPADSMDPKSPEYLKIYVQFWSDLGFDCVPMEVRLDLPFHQRHDKVSAGSEQGAMIANFEDFERYPWPEESAPMDFTPFEIVAGMLPEGMKIVGGPGRGPFEWISTLMGVQGASMAIYQQPDLVEAMFERLGRLGVSAIRELASWDAVGALRQGDDLGFKTGTFLNPDHLRQYVFPIYKRMVEVAHAHNKPFILHSCGNLNEVYDDLIDNVGIDAKHSFEEAILPVSEFKRRYGTRVTPLGGLDVDRLCRGTEAEIRAYVRQAIEACYENDGFWAIGAGNMPTAYLPVEHYMWVLDEARQIAG